MAYIGRPASALTAAQAFTDTFTGNGATQFVLTRAVTDSNASLVEVLVSNVQQQPTVSYTITGNVITFTEAPGSGEPIYVIFRDNLSAPFFTVPDLAITEAKLATSSVTTTKIADLNVTTAKLAVTGVTAGNYGNATLIPALTVGVDGRITSASNVAIVGGATIADDTATNLDTFYPVMANTQTTGTFSDATVSSTKLYFNPSSGILNATDFNSLSDLVLKTDLEPITNASEILNKINGFEFKWKDTSRKSAGVIAQDVEAVLPHLVNNNGNGVKSVNYGSLTAYLIQCVKELSARIEQLEKKNGV